MKTVLLFILFSLLLISPASGEEKKKEKEVQLAQMLLTGTGKGTPKESAAAETYFVLLPSSTDRVLLPSSTDKLKMPGH